jgi:hypothetical protein
MPSNKKWLDIIKVQEQSRDLHETFHSLLDRAEDAFSLVADYFGRGVFKKLMVIADWQQPQLIKLIKEQNSKYDYELDTERIRINEGKNSMLNK